ncbi:VLRF1 family aeRF1-type release factor [Sporosarcina sp. G11-34]|uniref:VLRF1 family aeRF1-type release factor n=1 Tax=Sporosarcina sp. G11-34 TaxID=2849605 RepID=UPI0022A97782|nr:VLRF1 family aeRF1-type release factor [Sporosarcina sp. G11-34]MCZ2256915.1 antiporter [Sporosarcina sp. G11-34]
MSLSDEIKTLKEFYCEDRCVLSVYLNTNPGDPQQLNGGWKIHLKSGFKRILEYIDASKDEKELKAFTILKDKITNEVESNLNNLSKSVVIFAAVDPELWSVNYVQVPVKTSFHWENQPMTEEMEYMYKAYPEAGIILPSFGEVRILDTAMGAVKEELSYEFDSNVDGWRIRKIESANHDRGTEKTTKPALEPRPRTNIKTFYKGMGNVVEKLKKERGWHEIHISGEIDLANAFAETMREKPASCIYKNLNKSKTNDVIHQVFEK